MSESYTPSPEALIAQLKELNQRSRTYGRQFWQVPFAYLAASGVVLVQLAHKSETPTPLRIALIIIAVIGGFTIWHLAHIYRAAHRCFYGLRDIEKKLNLLDDATKWTPGHLWALLSLTIAASLASLLAVVSVSRGPAPPSWPMGRVEMADWPITALTAALVIITGYYALQNRRMVQELRRQNQMAVEPRVILRLGSIMLGGRTGAVDARPILEMENIGRGPALFVQASSVVLTDPVDGLRFSVDFRSADVLLPGEKKKLDAAAARPVSPVDDQAQAGFFYGNCLDPESAKEDYLFVLRYEDAHARVLESRVQVGRGGVKLLSFSKS